MRVLLDHCVTRLLARELPGHEIRTAYEMGWASLRNGELIRSAGGAFDVLLTVDQNLLHQQNIGVFPLSIVVVVVRRNKMEAIRPLVPAIRSLLDQKLERRMYIVGPVA